MTSPAPRPAAGESDLFFLEHPLLTLHTLGHDHLAKSLGLELMAINTKPAKDRALDGREIGCIRPVEVHQLVERHGGLVMKRGRWTIFCDTGCGMYGCIRYTSPALTVASIKRLHWRSNR